MENHDVRNYNIVNYRHILHAKRLAQYEGWNVDSHGTVQPFQWLRSFYYRKLEDFANIVVDVPNGSTCAIASTKKPSKAPFKSTLMQYHFELTWHLLSLAVLLYSYLTLGSNPFCIVILILAMTNVLLQLLFWCLGCAASVHLGALHSPFSRTRMSEIITTKWWYSSV